MNRIFRLVWNESLNAYVPAAETARGRGKSSKRKLIATALSLSASIAQAGPTGGQVTGGSGTITQSGSTTTVQQSSQNLSLNWQTFNIAPQETVDFVQPNVSAIAVNRILSTNGSVILGHLNANGQVFLINPNGVLFGKGAEVNVGGLVASTLDLNDSTLGLASKTFSGAGTGSIINDGTLNAATGGSIALLGNHVSNNGVISAQLGTVALGAGSAATLTFHGTNLVGMQIDQSVLNSVASNGGLIRADGGKVLMTAGAQKALLASVVNNTGVIEARTLENHEGTITLLGGMTAGTVNVGGTLDASAPSGGNGGFIETSAAHVHVASTANVTTAAALGLVGSWTIDPDGFTVAPSGGDMTGTAVSNALANNNFTIASTNGIGSDGNVNINDAVSWAAHTLTLTATNDVNINAVMTATGAASLDLAPGSNNLNVGVNPDGTFKGRVDFSGSGTLRMNVNGTLQVFTVINTLGSAADATGGGDSLQGMAATSNLGGYFALGSNIDANATATWNACTACNNGSAGHYGFTPIGNPSTNFTGILDGLGHTISHLTINQPSYGNIGLFGSANGTIQNVGLIGASISGGNYSGGLVGNNYGIVRNSYSNGGVVTGANYTGGLIGINSGTISNSSVGGGATYGSARYVGGLLGGGLAGLVTQSFSTSNVTGSDLYAGGFVGINNTSSTITDSYATGMVSATTKTGGFVGWNNGIMQRDHATGTVNGASYVGGFAGFNTGVLSDSYALGNVVATGNRVGGMIGNSYGSVDNLYATGNVTGASAVGGLIGTNSGPVSNSYAKGIVTGSTYVGGLVGQSYSSTSNCYATGSVTGGRYTGGLVGQNYGSVTNSFATGDVTGTLNVGGLVGSNALGGGAIQDSYATGSVTGGDVVGGLVGFNYGPLANSYSTGAVNAGGATYAGGLVGLTYVPISNNFYNSSANQTLTGIGGVADVAGNVWGMSAANLQKQANFTSATIANGSVNPGWDFASTWFMYEGNTTPLLQVFMTPLTVSGTVTQTYNGAVFAPTISNLTYSIVPDASHLFGTVTVVGSALGALHAGTYSFTPGGMYSDQLGYMISYSAGSLTINPAPLTVVGSSATKVYDGTTVAPLSGGTLVGVFGGDTVTLTQAGSFTSKNAGASIAITANDSIGGGSASDYTLVEPTGVTGTITPATLTVSGTTVGSKVYTGTTAASLTGGSLVGLIGGDTVTLTQTGNFATKNAGTGIAVTAADGLSGTDASDYTIVEPTGLTGTITPATLTVSGTTVSSKVYNGTTAASLTGGSLVGLIGGDTVTLTQTGNFATKNAGTGIAVTAADGLGGADASDYTIVEPTGLTGAITPATLTVSGTTVGSKVYNGTTAASLTGGSLIGLIGGDTVTLTQTGSFASKNAGTGIAVTAADGLSGTDASDYTIVEPTGLTGTITPATLTVSGTTVGGKTYNGTTAASLTGGSLVGVVSGDTVTLNQSGIFASAGVGSGIAVTATDSLSGTSAFDYSISEPTGLTGSISPASNPPNSSSGLVLAALNARTQIVENFIYPQLGANPQVINPSPTIAVLATSADGASADAAVSHQAIAVNVSMKIGANGTLKIENGGLRLPNNLVVGDE